MVMGELTTYADVVVIGGGPGGYTAAIRCAQLGKEVVLVEKEALGGVCTNVGCIPSKALIHAAEIYHSTSALDFFSNTRLDFKKLQQWQKKMVKKLSSGIEKLCNSYGIEVIKGRAFFKSGSEVEVETESGLRRVVFKHAVVATGTKPRALEYLPYSDFVINSDGVFSLEELPERIVIVGGGYIAVEMAALFARLGAAVDLVYRGERLLKRFDHDLSTAVARGLEEIGVNLFFNTNVIKAEKNGKHCSVMLDGGNEILCDKVLLAVGRVPVLDIGLEKASVEYGKFIKVDRQMRTSNPNIFAVGDVVGGKAVAHKAFREGKVAAEVIAGLNSEFDSLVPEVVFTYPTIASVGDMAKPSLKSVRYPLSVLGAAKTLGDDRGFVKIVYDDAGIVRGIHIAGVRAAEVIGEATFALEMGAFLEDLALSIHPHPTMPEMLSEACEFALGSAIHFKSLTQ